MSKPISAQSIVCLCRSFDDETHGRRLSWTVDRFPSVCLFVKVCLNCTRRSRRRRVGGARPVSQVNGCQGLLSFSARINQGAMKRGSEGSNRIHSRTYVEEMKDNHILFSNRFRFDGPDGKLYFRASRPCSKLMHAIVTVELWGGWQLVAGCWDPAGWIFRGPGCLAGTPGWQALAGWQACT